MPSTEPVEGPFQEHEAFDPVEVATEADLFEAEAAEQAEVAAAAPVAAPEPAADSQTGLLERALKAAGSDAARYLPVRFVPALTSLVTTPLFTRVIDAKDYGAFYLLSSVASLLAAIFISWLQSASIRFYWPAHKEGRLDGYISTVTWIGFASLASAAAVTGLAVLLARDRIEPVVLRLIPVGLLYFVLNFYVTAMLQVLRAAKRASAFARLQVGSTLLVTVVSILLVWQFHWGALGILAGAALGNLAVVPLLLRELRAEGSLSPAHVDRGMLRELFAYGLPLIPSGLAGWALVVLDRFVVEYYRGAAEVGIYSVSYALGDKIMQLVTMPLLLTMMPSLIEAYEKHGQALAEKVQMQFTRYFAILTLPLLAGMWAAAPVFMTVFTGPQYRGAYHALALVSAGSMLGSFAQIAGAGLGMHKKTTLIMANCLAAAALNTALNIAFVPRYGYLAAAWATLAAYAALLGLTWWQSRRYMRWIVPVEALVRVTLASAGMLAAVWALGRLAAPSLGLLLAQVLLGVVAYTALLLAVGGVRPAERAFLRTIAGRAIAKVAGR